MIIFGVGAAGRAGNRRARAVVAHLHTAGAEPQRRQERYKPNCVSHRRPPVGKIYRFTGGPFLSFLAALRQALYDEVNLRAALKNNHAMAVKITATTRSDEHTSA